MKSIKRLSLVLAAAFTLGSGLAMASETRGEGRKSDPKERVEKMTDRMVKEYGLDDSQKQQLLELNQTFAEKMDGRAPHHRHGKRGKAADAGKRDGKERADKEKREGKEKRVARADQGKRPERPDAPKISTEEREKRMAERKVARENYNARLQQIMNADQYQAFTKKQAEQEQKRAERAQKMKERQAGKGQATEKNDQKV